MFRKSLIGILLISSIVVAQDATTQLLSPAAQQAEIKYNIDVKRLDADYFQKVNLAKKVYVETLKTALKNLAKQDNADPKEIANLSAKIQEVQATVIQSPVATTQVKRISGKWHDVWVGGNGAADVVFKKDGTVVLTVEPWHATWLQDGNNIVTFSDEAHVLERLTLSPDGKTMKGSSPAHAVYTYLGE